MRTELDCNSLGIHNGQDLLELCSAESAAKYLTNLVAGTTEADEQVVERVLSASSGSDSEEDPQIGEGDLRTITISVMQLCKKLKKINHRFGFEIVNDNDDWREEHQTDNLSPAKKQRKFCEHMISDIIDWQN